MPQPNNKAEASLSKKLERLTALSALSAVALIIFIIELQIPNPSPIAGVKLGLSNIVIVFGIYRYSAGETALVLLSRILLGSFFSANPSAVFFSLSGGAFCLLAMIFLRRIIPKNHLWLCSVFGSVFHNIGQVIAAFFIMKTSAVFIYLPFLLVSGCVAGAFTGLCAGFILKRASKNIFK